MTLKELQRWILKNDEEDSWWVALDGEVQESVMSLPDVSKFKEQHTEHQVSLLHVSKAEDENAEWIIFERLDAKNIKIAGVGGSRQQFKVPTQTSSAQQTEEAPAQEPEPAAAPVDDELREEVAALRQELNIVKEELLELKALSDEVKEPLSEARQILEEREKFLEIGENALFEKAQKQEVLQTELEQLRDELAKRERYVETREKEMASKAAG